jgi:CheY-like chemotaxis protein
LSRGKPKREAPNLADAGIHDDLETLARNKAKILVVDDEDVMAEMTAFMLTYEGRFVETATNADVAFDLYCQYLAEAQPFDFVLSGLAQPGMNGIDLVETTI